MRTIGHKRSHRSPPGDSVRLCSYCGVAWYRSQLTRDASGNLACPDELPGRDVVTLNEGNLAWYSSRRVPGQTGMPTDGTVPSKSTEVAPDVDWNSSSAPPLNQSPIGALSVQTKLWTRGDQVGLTNGAVAFWTDQSNSQNTLSVSASQPTWTAADATLGGLPTLTCNGVAQCLFTTSIKMGGPLWVWFILRQDAWVSGGTIFNIGFGLQQHTSSPNMHLLTNSGIATDNGAAAVGAWFRGIAACNVTGTDILAVGSSLASNASSGQRNGTGFTLGAATPAGAAPSSISVAEVLVTTPAPTAAEQAALDAYGQARYGSGLF